MRFAVLAILFLIRVEIDLSNNFLLLSWRKFLFPPSSFMVFDHLKICAFLYYGQIVKTRTKNCLVMALYLFQFLWASTIRVLRSTLSSFPLAMLTPVLQEECQILQKSKLILDIRTLQKSINKK